VRAEKARERRWFQNQPVGWRCGGRSGVLGEDKISFIGSYLDRITRKPARQFAPHARWAGIGVMSGIIEEQ